MTTVAARALDLQPGDLVDFHRPPNQKDESGWKGPATVIRDERERGLCVFKWQKEEVNVRYPDVRRHMDFTSLVYGTFCPNRAIQMIETHVSSMRKGDITTIGYMQLDQNIPTWTKAKCDTQIALAMEHFARVTLGMNDLFQLKFGRAVKRFPRVSEATAYTLIA